jgi:cell fate (sporulation/competence/biofilm development) regulator YmcA (YheA/YmcA/DUF963 family)
VYIHQYKIIEGALVESIKDYQKLALQILMVEHLDKEDSLCQIEQQTKLRSRVGMLLYLVKNSRFDIATVRDLSQVADGEIVPRSTKYITTTE